MEHASLISIAQKVIHTFGKDRQLTLCCTVYSRARSIILRLGKSARFIQGREQTRARSNPRKYGSKKTYEKLNLLSIILRPNLCNCWASVFNRDFA